MNIPINYKFVTYETIPISTENGNREISVLVLNKEENENYWKVIHSFPKFLIEQGLESPDKAKQWLISTAFAKKEAYQDLIEDFVNSPFKTNSDEVKIYDIPITYIEDENVYCVLQLADESLVENTLWK